MEEGHSLNRTTETECVWESCTFGNDRSRFRCVLINNQCLMNITSDISSYACGPFGHNIIEVSSIKVNTSIFFLNSM